MTYIYELLYVTELYEFTANVKLCQYLADIHMQVYKERLGRVKTKVQNMLTLNHTCQSNASCSATSPHP